MLLLCAASLCCRFDPFIDINCLARIDFSNSNLCCGLAPKPTHCLKSTTLMPTIVDLLSCVMASFVFWPKQGKAIADAGGITSDASVLNQTDTSHYPLCHFRSVSVVWLKLGRVGVFGQITVTSPRICSHYKAPPSEPSFPSV